MPKFSFFDSLIVFLRYLPQNLMKIFFKIDIRNLLNELYPTMYVSTKYIFLLYFRVSCTLLPLVSPFDAEIFNSIAVCVPELLNFSRYAFYFEMYSSCSHSGAIVFYFFHILL